MGQKRSRMPYLQCRLTVCLVLSVQCFSFFFSFFCTWAKGINIQIQPRKLELSNCFREQKHKHIFVVWPTYCPLLLGEYQTDYGKFRNATPELQRKFSGKGPADIGSREKETISVVIWAVDKCYPFYLNWSTINACLTPRQKEKEKVKLCWWFCIEL